MGSYNIDSIKAELEAKLQPKAAATNNTSGGSKITYWKPTMGEHDIRFLPYKDLNGQPFEKLSFYEKIADRRVLAPSSFGLPDPISEMFATRRVDKDKEAWQITKNLKAKERYFAVIVVRGEEEKGPQVWEFSENMKTEIYKTLAHKDNVDEDMFHPETGYDFTVSVTPEMENGKPRMFNGYPVKNISLTPRKKPSKLGTAKEIEAFLKAMPNIREVFTAQVKKPEELLVIAENYVRSFTTATSALEPKSTAIRTPGSKQTEDKLSDAFSDIS